MRAAYADPPYPGQARRHYRDHPDYAGEVDHAALLDRLAGYDGWVLHTSSPALRDLLPLCPPDTRVMAWVKTYTSFGFSRAVPYAWEPVLVRPCRALFRSRDWIAEPAPHVRGRQFTGTKPEAVCWWVFDVLGLEPGDELDDLYPGSGAVGRAWQRWQAERPLPLVPVDQARLL